MKLGDLVKPMVSCSGDPGDKRCETAVVTGLPAVRLVTIYCNCGYSEQCPQHLEVVKNRKKLLDF